jgi:hypothetical protein
MGTECGLASFSCRRPQRLRLDRGGWGVLALLLLQSVDACRWFAVAVTFTVVCAIFIFFLRFTRPAIR